MKTAFVHDRIVHEGGAEAVLRNLIESHEHSEAKIFTLFSIHKEFQMTRDERREKKDSSFVIRHSSLDIVTALPNRLNNIFVYFNTRKVPILSALFDYRNLMFWFPILCNILRKKIEKYKADEVVISSFAAVKNVIKYKAQSIKHKENSYELGIMNYELGPKVILYLHSPMQYIRENYEENVKKLSFPIKQLYTFSASYLRPRDKKPRHYDVVLCNSNYTAELAKQLYGLEGQVLYPQVDKAFFNEQIVDISKDYFVFVGRVQKFVREIGTIIEACNQTNSSLVVIGDGPDMDYAKSIAGPTIIFVGRIDDVQEKIAIMKYAKGIINIAKESFGIATAEALCLGVPVLGYNGGATPELVDEMSGVLIEKDISKGSMYNIQCTIIGIEDFCSKVFDRKKIAEVARKRFTK